MADNTHHIPYIVPEFPSFDAISRYFQASREANWYSNFGPCHELLSERIGNFIGSDTFAVPVSNCTSGLAIALHALTDSRKTYVVTPSYTFVATAAAIEWAGFTPLFVDSDTHTWHVDTESLATAIHEFGDSIAAVLCCSTYGTAPPISQRNEWEMLCREANIPLILDSAAGFGSTDESEAPLGRQGNCEVFSFHITKPFGIGEGGVATTKDETLATKLRRLVNFGFDENRHLGDTVGINAKMSELQAATALAVFDEYPSRIELRQKIAGDIRRDLERLGFEFQVGSERSTWQAICVMSPNPGVRDRVLHIGHRAGISIRSYFDTPLHRTEPFSNCPMIGTLPTTNGLAQRCLSVPLHERMSSQDIDLIIATLSEACHDV